MEVLYEQKIKNKIPGANNPTSSGVGLISIYQSEES